MDWHRNTAELLSTLLALRSSSKEARQKLLDSRQTSFDIVFNRLSCAGDAITAESLQEFLEANGLAVHPSGLQLLIAMNSSGPPHSRMSEANLAAYLGLEYQPANHPKTGYQIYELEYALSRVLEEDASQLVRLWKLASRWKPRDLALAFDALDCYREQQITAESVRQFLVCSGLGTGSSCVKEAAWVVQTLAFGKQSAAPGVDFAEWCGFFARLGQVQVAAGVKVDQALLRKQSRAFSESMKVIEQSFRSTSQLELSRLFLPGNLSTDRRSDRDHGVWGLPSPLLRSSSRSSLAPVPLSAASLEAFASLVRGFAAVAQLQAAVALRPDFTVATLTGNKAWPATKTAVCELARLVTDDRFVQDCDCRAVVRVFRSADGLTLDLRRLFCPKYSSQSRVDSLLSNKRDSLTRDRIGAEYLSKKSKLLVKQLLAGLFAYFRAVEKALAVVCLQEGLLAFSLGLAHKKSLQVSPQSVLAALRAHSQPKLDSGLVSSWLCFFFGLEAPGSLDYQEFADLLAVFT